MQILLVSDLHYTLKQLDWVASVAADYDLVVVAGDHLDIASIVEPDAQIAVVLEYLARMADEDHRRRVLGQPRPQRAQRARRARRVVARRGARVRRVRRRDARRHRRRARHGVPVVGRPAHAASVVDRQLAADAALVGDRRWIWVYHAPPDDVADELDRQAALRRRGARRVDRAAPARPSCCAGTCTSRRSRPTAAWIDRIGSTLVVQRRPPDAARSRRASRSTPTPARASWSSLEGVEEQTFARGLVLGVGVAFGAELGCACPSCASGCRARRRPCRGRPRGRRTGA